MPGAHAAARPQALAFEIPANDPAPRPAVGHATNGGRGGPDFGYSSPPARPHGPGGARPGTPALAPRQDPNAQRYGPKDSMKQPSLDNWVAKPTQREPDARPPSNINGWEEQPVGPRNNNNNRGTGFGQDPEPYARGTQQRPQQQRRNDPWGGAEVQEPQRRAGGVGCDFDDRPVGGAGNRHPPNPFSAADEFASRQQRQQQQQQRQQGDPWQHHPTSPVGRNNARYDGFYNNNNNNGGFQQQQQRNGGTFDNFAGNNGRQQQPQQQQQNRGTGYWDWEQQQQQQQQRFHGGFGGAQDPNNNQQDAYPPGGPLYDPRYAAPYGPYGPQYGAPGQPLHPHGGQLPPNQMMAPPTTQPQHQPLGESLWALTPRARFFRDLAIVFAAILGFIALGLLDAPRF